MTIEVKLGSSWYRLVGRNIPPNVEWRIVPEARS